MMKLTTLTLCCVAVTCAVTVGAQSNETTTKTAAPANDGRAQDPTISAPALSAPKPPPPRISPQQHLKDAQDVLTGVSEKSLPAKAQKYFTQLVTDFAALSSSYTAAPTAGTWQSTLYDVERDLVRLVGGGGPATPVDDGKSIPGLAAEISDPATRLSLQAFRTHIELFYDAATTREPAYAQPSQ